VKKKSNTLFNFFLLLIVGAIILNGCEKQHVIHDNDSWADFYYDSLGYKHNIITLQALNVHKESKDSIDYAELYEIICFLISEEYDVPVSEMPTYVQIKEQLMIALDTSLSFLDRYKLLNADFSQKEIDYVISIEETFLNSANSTNYMNSISLVEDDIVFDTDLADKTKGDLINLTDLSKFSYKLWEDYSSQSKVDDEIWVIVGSDLLGAVVGGRLLGVYGILPGCVLFSAAAAITFIDN